MHPSLLHHRDDRLSPAELSACRLDGELFELGDAYVAADVPDSASLRALSLKTLLRGRLALAGPSAAWVHGARYEPPWRHHVRPTTTRRLRVDANALLRFHESPVDGADLDMIAGVPVTGVVETLCDLARGDRPRGDQARGGDTEHHTWLRALAATQPECVPGAVQRLRERSRVPGKRTAIVALEEVYEEVTRYTS